MNGKKTEHLIYENQTHCFYISFDLGRNEGDIEQQENPWIEEVFDEIANFALGKKRAIEISQGSPRRAHKLGLRLLYEVKELKEANVLYAQNSNLKNEDKYLKRGEFGELILYHLLANKLEKPQVISKIYFKDNFNSVVHGFDGVHYDIHSNELWLGESKFYKSRNSALTNLAQDLEEHFNIDFFSQEFSIIHNRFNDLGIENDELKNLIDPDTKFISKLIKINACFFALFDSEVFESFSFEEGTDTPSQDFLTKLSEEVNQAKNYFDNQILNYRHKDRLKIHLFLFPVKDKYALVKKMHDKLKAEQGNYNG